MTSKRVVAGLAAVSVIGLVVAGGVLSCQELRETANLAGEQVKPAVGVQKIAANEGATALWQSLVKLRTRASLMMIVAHPDDEDGGMLTYEARGQGAHVAMLTLTRGEGGQNLMSADFEDAGAAGGWAIYGDRPDVGDAGGLWVFEDEGRGSRELGARSRVV